MTESFLDIQIIVSANRDLLYNFNQAAKQKQFNQALILDLPPSHTHCSQTLLFFLASVD